MCSGDCRTYQQGRAMKIDEVRKLSVWDRYIYWVKERWAIRQRRENQDLKPWTDDEILQQYRFCNVRRMDDKVSLWLYHNWYLPHYGHPNMLVACVIARHFNLPAALSEITPHVFGKYCPKSIKKIMRARKAAGQTCFSGAYMVRGMAKKEANWTDCKSDQIIDLVCGPLRKKPPEIDPTSMQRSVEALLPYWGFSSFMAGQVIADLRWATKGTWADKYEWAPMGPGSKRGLNRLLSNVPTTPMSQETFNEDFREVRENAAKELPGIATRLEAMDWQNTLCEFDKYERTLSGEGKPKQRYPGAA